MSRPEDISRELWDAAVRILDAAGDASNTIIRDIGGAEVIARAIMAAKAEERAVFTDAGLDSDALNSAVGVMRTKQAQPHHSTQHVLWEAIKDYAERAAIRKRGEG